MKKTIILLIALSALFALTSCISTNTVLDTRKVDAPVAIADPDSYRVAGSMEKTFKITYPLFSLTQKPTDEEILEKILKESQKKYGPQALPEDIYFARIRKDTTDVAAIVTGSLVDFSDTDYKMKVTWNVYVPR